MIVKLPFGEDTAALDLRGIRVRPLAPRAPAGCSDVCELVAGALDSPLDGASLTDLARSRTSAAIVVPDSTRKAWLPEVLPPIFDRLSEAGIEGSSISVVVANGTHPPAEPDSISRLVGVLPMGVRVIEHESRRTEDLVVVGALRSGLDLRLQRAVVESDLLVTVGTVKHHYFAGFGGGPKMVFPGVAGYDEIQANHALVIRNTAEGPLREPGCEPGVLESNPVAAEIQTAADLCPPDLALCLVEGLDQRPAWAGAGRWRTAYFTAIDTIRRWFEIESDQRFQLMVASGGGSPSDSTLIQGHKSLDAACRFLEPGGELLYMAALDQGLGSPEMERFVARPQPEQILKSLASQWVQYGHTTLRLVEKTDRFRINLYSSFDSECARSLGFEPVSDPDETIERWRRDYPGSTVGVMAGSPVYPRPVS